METGIKEDNAFFLSRQRKNSACLLLSRHMTVPTILVHQETYILFSPFNTMYHTFKIGIIFMTKRKEDGHRVFNDSFKTYGTSTVQALAINLKFLIYLDTGTLISMTAMKVFPEPVPRYTIVFLCMALANSSSYKKSVVITVLPTISHGYIFWPENHFTPFF
jgi:hypothetical protein